MFNETKSLQRTLPLAAAAAFLIARTDGFLTSFFFWHFQTGFHELGHTLAGWMGGQIAIPTYGFTLTFGHSGAFFFCFIATISFGIWKTREHEYFYLMTVLCLMGISAMILGTVSTTAFRQMIFVIGGYLGEALLSTFLICGFYYKFPERLRWDFFRYPIVLIAFVVLFKSHNLWSLAQKSTGHLPMGGSILSESDQSDTEKLLDSGYWTGKTLPNFLVKAHQICFFLIAGHYILGLIYVSPTAKLSQNATDDQVQS
jgi:hypothetical protein